MNIYFTASTSNDGTFRDHYKKIITYIKKSGYHLLSGEQTINRQLLKKDKELSDKKIFKREKLLIDQADCVIAEVSLPSHGVGGEIVYALIHDKPVLGLVFENHEDTISPMLEGNPSDNFFFEHYTFGKLPYILKEFLLHVEAVKKRKGKLIVVDGGDGSGKTTQAHLLMEYLKKHTMLAKYMDFPQYYSSFHGKTVARFLRGEFGTLDQVSPYLAALAFAVDRASVKNEMDDFLKKGGYIIANRYATSSMAHQAAKFMQKNDQEEFLKWEYEMEYKVHKIPKEDIVIYLYVPWQYGISLTKKKGNRAYLQGKSEDIHESNLSYRQAVESMYLALVRRYPHWVMITCVEDNKVLSPQAIHKKILTVLLRKNILPGS